MGMSREIAEATGFWKETIEHQLLKPEQLEQCLSEIPEEKRTPDKIENRLARVAIHHKFLTLWQAQRILTRRTASLFIDKYQLIDSLGQGGMGRVFLARDRRLNRLVAIKVLNPDRANHERSLARFEREALVGGQLQHENLVRIYDVGVFNNSPYLVMEYIEGPTVSELIEKNGRMDVAQAARIGRDVVLGLGHLADKKMVHRDVNPRNILINQEGKAKLTDLGLAIFEEQLGQVTSEGSTVGTFDYISPEQARSSRGVDIRSDFYSLGCSLYQMVSGQVPFPAGSLPEKIFAHQAREPEKLEKLVPGIDRAMVRIISRCMNKKPEDRYQNAAELVDLLGRLTTPDSPFKPIDLLRSGTGELPLAANLPNIDSNDPNLANKAVANAREVSWHGENEPSPEAQLNSDADAVKIDLGNDSLELTKRDAYRSSADRSSEYSRSPLVGIGVAAAVILVLVVMVTSGRGKSKRPSAMPKPGVESGKVVDSAAEKNTPVVASQNVSNKVPGIVVKYADGSEAPCGTLTEALRKASGQNVEILLHSDDQAIVWQVLDNSPIVGPKLVIRSRDGEITRLNVDLSKSSTGIQVRAGSALELVGLSIETAGQKPKTPIINSIGNLTIDRCWMIQRNESQKELLAISSSAPQMLMKNTWIHGYGTALELKLLARNRTILTNCLLTLPENSGGPAAKKAAANLPLISVNYSKARNEGVVLEMDHCSLIGRELIGLVGNYSGQSIEINNRRCLFKGESLVGWGSIAGPDTMPIRWNGENNIYDIDLGFLVGPGRESSLKAFADWSGTVLEKNSRAVKVTLLNRKAQLPKPSDFIPKDAAFQLFGYQ
jgi:serine/threonine protein kinase